MDWLSKAFGFLFGSFERQEEGLIEPPPLPSKRFNRLTAGQILGPVKHQKIYVFTVTDRGRDHSSCKVCKDPEVTVFSDAIDVLEQKCRMCLRCLKILGGDDQLELAASRSKYARRWLECVKALDKMQAKFPDPQRRPYGDKALLMEMKRPFSGYDGIERILHKIDYEAWTEIDLIAVEKGRDVAGAVAKERYES